MSPTRAARGMALALAVLLAACAELPVAPGGTQVEFELAGRIAAHYRGEATSGNLSWRHTPERDDLLITTALGQGVARITRSGGGVTLTTAEEREYRAADAEALTEQVLGFRVPLAGLADWVRARPAPGQVAERRDASGRLLELEQMGWRIEYLDWTEGGRLPSRLRLHYPGVELRLAIAQWK